MVGGEPVPGDLAGIHDVRQADKHRVGEPMAAQIMSNPLDRIELRVVRRKLQQSDLSGHHETLAPVPGAVHLVCRAQAAAISFGKKMTVYEEYLELLHAA